MAVIRRATVEDAAAIAHVHVDSWRVTYASLGEEFLATLDANERTSLWTRVLGDADADADADVDSVLVAESHGTIVAFANVRASRDPGASPSTGEVVAIYATPEAWGTGAGRDLMAAAVDELRHLGFTEAILWVLETNTRARRFYELAGWQPDGAEKDEVWRGATIHEVRYCRAL